MNGAKSALQEHVSRLSTEELTLLDKRLPVEVMNTLTIQRLFIGLSAQREAEIRGLQKGHIEHVKPAPVNIMVDTLTTRSFNDSQNLAAALLWEFPVGTGLEDMLLLFQRSMYDYFFYRVPKSSILPSQVNTFCPFAKRGLETVYFDDDGVVRTQSYRSYIYYESSPRKTPLSDISVGGLVRRCDIPDDLLRKALLALHPGDTLDKLNARLRNTDTLCKSKKRLDAFDVRSNVFGKELDRMVGVIRTPSFPRLPGNPNKSTFDFVTVEVTLIKSFYGKEVVQRLRPYLPALNQRVLDKVRRSSKLAQRPLLANLLKIDRIDVQPDWTLLYTIGFKDGLTGVLQEEAGEV